LAALSEIDKLKARYEENPEGRYFAPLADAYRKSGRLDEAIELVKDGLTRHPDYLSAHIVLGRCYLDKKDDPAAKATLEGVLALDAENIIALKSLAEIAERMADNLGARKWLSQLLLIDPTNIDAEADLRRLGGPPPADAGEPAAAAPAEAESAPFLDIESEPPAAAAPPAALGAPPIDVVEFTPPAEPIAAPADMAGDIVPFDDSLEWGAGERTSRAIHAEDLERAEHEHAQTTAAIDFLATVPPAEAPPEAPPAAEPPMLDIEPAAAEPPPPPAAWEAPPQDLNVALDSSARASGAVSFDADAALGDRSVDLDGSVAASGPDLPLIMPEDVTPPEELARPSLKQVQTLSPEPAAAPADAPAAPMLTETMGDLYLRQGFRAEAADVYRRLLAQRPDDAALRAKLAMLESPAPSLSAAAAGAESLGTWLRRVARAAIPAPASAGAPPPPEAGASPLEQAFGDPESAAEAPPVGEPARPASDAYSLDRVFGAEAAPHRGAVAPPPSAPGASFDEFFGAAPPPGGARPSDAAGETAAAPEGDDLTSFNAWLHGLKR